MNRSGEMLWVTILPPDPDLEEEEEEDDEEEGNDESTDVESSNTPVVTVLHDQERIRVIIPRDLLPDLEPSPVFGSSSRRRQNSQDEDLMSLDYGSSKQSS